MRHIREVLFLALLLAVLAGCASTRPLAEALSQSPQQVQVRFLKESKGSNYLSAPVSGAALDALLGALRACPQAKTPTEPFAPQLDSDEQIAMGDDAAQLYVSTERKLVVWLDARKSSKEMVLQAHYYQANDDLLTQLVKLHGGAALQQDATVQPFRSQEELKTSIDTDDLAEDSNELDFDFYADPLPQYQGTSCRAYDSVSDTAVPAGSVLIAAYGKNQTGQQISLPITGLEANPFYTKVLVTQPDDALDSVQATDGPSSSAILVNSAILDYGKWIVFVDEDGNILDVIVPADVFTAPQATLQPGATATPGDAPEGGSGDDNGSGDTGDAGADGGGE